MALYTAVPQLPVGYWKLRGSRQRRTIYTQKRKYLLAIGGYSFRCGNKTICRPIKDGNRFCKAACINHNGCSVFEAGVGNVNPWLLLRICFEDRHPPGLDAHVYLSYFLSALCILHSQLSIGIFIFLPLYFYILYTGAKPTSFIHCLRR